MTLLIEPTGKYEMTSWVDCDDETMAALVKKVDQLPTGIRLEGNRWHDPGHAGSWRLNGGYIVFESVGSMPQKLRLLYCDEGMLELGEVKDDPSNLVFTRRQSASSP